MIKVLSVLVVFAGLLALILLGQTSAAVLGAYTVLSLGLLAFLNLGEFKSFKAGAFSAELREAREAISSLHATTDQLRALAAALVEVNAGQLMEGEFMDGMPKGHRMRLHDRLMDALRDLGIAEDRLKEVDRYWLQGAAIIYHRAIFSRLPHRDGMHKINPNASEGEKELGRKFEQLIDFPRWHVEPPERMREVLDEAGFRTAEIDELLEDYRHLIESGGIRRPHVFVGL